MQSMEAQHETLDTDDAYRSFLGSFSISKLNVTKPSKREKTTWSSFNVAKLNEKLSPTPGYLKIMWIVSNFSLRGVRVKGCGQSLTLATSKFDVGQPALENAVPLTVCQRVLVSGKIGVA